MLHTLFRRSGLKYERSPFAREMRGFYEWLHQTGYSNENIGGHLRRLFKVLTRSRQFKSDDARSRAALHSMFGRHCTCVERSQHFRGTERAYCRFLQSQHRLQEEERPSDPVTSLLHRYRKYLHEVRGFAETTVIQHEHTVSEFLKMAVRPGQSIRMLTREHVERFLIQRGKAITRQSMQHLVAHLRAFLRYGIARRLVRAGLDTIDTPRTYRDELPPRALPWPIVMRLLQSVDRSSKAGWRDFMILHLMAYYGLRASEIAALRVDSIDWDANTCRVEQRKTQSDLLLPLSKQTVALLRRYLRAARSASDLPQLFLRARRPSGGLRHYAVCDIFYKRATQSRLPLEGYSSYSLRHSFAMRLLQRGVGVKAIGDLLGHHSLEATCVYLRLDTSALRSAALPLPTKASRGHRGSHATG
jgi:site-specific recombinase XerD